MDLLATLNQAQRQAVEAEDGQVLIVAGPGTGKTKTLTTRIVYLLSERRINPEAIIALTFTNKAAQEMRERVAALLPKQAKLPEITTFHAYGHALLQREERRELITDAARTQLIRDLAKPAALKGTSVRELGLILSRAKTTLSSIADDGVKVLLERYNAALAEQDLLDFDDLLVQAYELLKKSTGKRFDYVLVDEFQDTSELQYELLRSLCAKGNIFAIGDPNQSIYGFRGAGAQMFDRFRQDYPQAQSIALTTNYRSVPEVVHLANAIFPDSPALVAHTKELGAVHAIQTLNEYGEAAYILTKIEQGIGGSDFRTASTADACQLRDYAVLYRTHRAAQTVRRYFAESGIPFQVAGEGSPYEQPSMQALVTLLRYRYEKSEADRQAVLTTAKLQTVTAVQLDKLLDRLPDQQPVTELATQLAELFALWPEDNQQDLRQFSGMLVQFGTDLGAAVTHINDVSEQAFYDATVDAVTLLTIHASKGLEFDHVFLCAAEEGILPKIRKREAPDLAEERRLFYVAVTRARRQLDVLYAKRRTSEPAQLTSFAASLPTGVLPRLIDPAMAVQRQRAEKRRQQKAQTSLF